MKQPTKFTAPFVHKWLYGFAIAAIALFHVSTLLSGHNWGGDFSQYIHHAKNLAEGKPYNDILYIVNSFASVAPENYPPIFPLFLAPVYALWGLNLTAMKLLIVAFFVSALAVLKKIFENRLSPLCLLALVLIVGLNPYFWTFKHNILSEIPYLFFSLCSLYLMQLNCAEKKLGIVVLLGILMYLSYGTREIGLILPLSLLTYEILRFRKLTAGSLVALTLFVLLAGSQSLLMRFEPIYPGVVLQPGLVKTKGHELVEKQATDQAKEQGRKRAERQAPSAVKTAGGDVENKQALDSVRKQGRELAGKNATDSAKKQGLERAENQAPRTVKSPEGGSEKKQPTGSVRKQELELAGKNAIDLAKKQRRKRAEKQAPRAVKTAEGDAEKKQAADTVKIPDSGSPSTFDYVHFSPDQIFAQIRGYFQGFYRFWGGSNFSFGEQLVWVFNGFALAGFISVLVKKIAVTEVYFAGYLCAIFLFRGQDFARYLVPVLPFYVFYILIGISQLRFIRNHLETVLFLCMAILLSYAYFDFYLNQDYSKRERGITRQPAKEVFGFVRTETERNDILVARKPRVFSLYTQRVASEYPNFTQPEKYIQYMLAIDAKYLITEPKARRDRGNGQEVVDLVSKQYHEKFTLVFQNSNFNVYKISP